MEKVEGINNKIKVMIRNVYGFRDENTVRYDSMRCMTAASLEISVEPNFNPWRNPCYRMIRLLILYIVCLLPNNNYLNWVSVQLIQYNRCRYYFV